MSNIIKPTVKNYSLFIELLNDYDRIIKQSGRLTNGTARDYKSHLKQVMRTSNGKMVDWIEAVITANLSNKKSNIAGIKPIDSILKMFDDYFSVNHLPATEASQLPRWRNGYKNFAEVILGIYYANVWAFSDSNDAINLCKLVAKNAIFASLDVVDKVKKGNLGTKENQANRGNKYASWDNCKHVRSFAKKGTQIVVAGKMCIADDNTIANQAIKKAVFESYPLKFGSYLSLREYEVCHVWDLPTDPKYYASIANLVLVPRAFGQLTDHCPAVKELLRYEVFLRFGFKPDGESDPVKPKFYDKEINGTWRVI